MGIATSEDCNCLNDTLRQSLGIQCDIAKIWQELERRRADITPRDYLELELHCVDVLELLISFRYDRMEDSLSAGNFRVVCVDCSYIGNGDVQGVGPQTLFIARQNANHFVPLVHASAVVATHGAVAATHHSDNISVTGRSRDSGGCAKDVEAASGSDDNGDSEKGNEDDKCSEVFCKIASCDQSGNTRQ